MKKLIYILTLAAFMLSVAISRTVAGAPSHATISAPHSESASHKKAKRHSKQAPKKHVSKARAHRHK